MRIEYVLKVEAEYHIGAGLSRPGVADETIVQRPDGQLFVPAEHIRGLIRESCTQILYWIGRDKECCEAALWKAPVERERTGKGVPKTCGLNYFPADGDSCVLCRLFGTTFVPKRYRFSDAICIDEKEKSKKTVRTFNLVDPATGRVLMDLLFSFEMGAPTLFKGYIERLSIPSSNYQILEEVGLLIAGLRLVERIGKRSARGWGECKVESIAVSLLCEEKKRMPQEVAEEPECWERWLKAFWRIFVEKEGKGNGEHLVGAS